MPPGIRVLQKLIRTGCVRKNLLMRPVTLEQVFQLPGHFRIAGRPDEPVFSPRISAEAFRKGAADREIRTDIRIADPARTPAVHLFFPRMKGTGTRPSYAGQEELVRLGTG